MLWTLTIGHLPKQRVKEESRVKKVLGLKVLAVFEITCTCIIFMTLISTFTPLSLANIDMLGLQTGIYEIILCVVPETEISR